MLALGVSSAVELTDAAISRRCGRRTVWGLASGAAELGAAVACPGSQLSPSCAPSMLPGCAGEASSVPGFSLTVSPNISPGIAIAAPQGGLGMSYLESEFHNPGSWARASGTPCALHLSGVPRAQHAHIALPCQPGDGP